MHWLNVEESIDDDARWERPSLKTDLSRRQIPLQRDIVELKQIYTQNYRIRANRAHLLISQKAKPLSLRAISAVFDTASTALSKEAVASLNRQGLNGVSCHDLRHTAAVARMQRYRDAGISVDAAEEKLRLYFGWSPASAMPRLYARAYFETALSEVWNERFDIFVDSLRRVAAERS